MEAQNSKDQSNGTDDLNPNGVKSVDKAVGTEIPFDSVKEGKQAAHMFEVGKVMASTAVKTLCDRFDRLPLQSGEDANGLLDLLLETQKVHDWGIYPYQSVMMAMVARTTEPLTGEILGAMAVFEEWKDIKFVVLTKVMANSVRNRLRYDRLYRRQRDEERLEDYAKDIVNVPKVILPSVEETQICDLIITNCNPEVN